MIIFLWQQNFVAFCPGFPSTNLPMITSVNAGPINSPHWGRVAHIYASVDWSWLVQVMHVTSSATCHYLNQCWLFSTRLSRTCFIQEYSFEHPVYKMADMLSGLNIGAWTKLPTFWLYFLKFFSKEIIDYVGTLPISTNLPRLHSLWWLVCNRCIDAEYVPSPQQPLGWPDFNNYEWYDATYPRQDNWEWKDGNVFDVKDMLTDGDII